jgi:hypothetical protein
LAEEKKSQSKKQKSRRVPGSKNRQIPTKHVPVPKASAKDQKFSEPTGPVKKKWPVPFDLDRWHPSEIEAWEQFLVKFEANPSDYLKAIYKVMPGDALTSKNLSSIYHTVAQGYRFSFPDSELDLTTLLTTNFNEKIIKPFPHLRILTIGTGVNDYSYNAVNGDVAGLLLVWCSDRLRELALLRNNSAIKFEQLSLLQWYINARRKRMAVEEFRLGLGQLYRPPIDLVITIKHGLTRHPKPVVDQLIHSSLSYGGSAAMRDSEMISEIERVVLKKYNSLDANLEQRTTMYQVFSENIA